MHSWCGTIVVTEHLPSIGGMPEIPAGKPRGPCPNDECTKPDANWWSSSFYESEHYGQLRLEFDLPRAERGRRGTDVVATDLV